MKNYCLSLFIALGFAQSGFAYTLTSEEKVELGKINDWADLHSSFIAETFTSGLNQQGIIRIYAYSEGGTRKGMVQTKYLDPNNTATSFSYITFSGTGGKLLAYFPDTATLVVQSTAAEIAAAADIFTDTSRLTPSTDDIERMVTDVVLGTDGSDYTIKLIFDVQKLKDNDMAPDTMSALETTLYYDSDGKIKKIKQLVNAEEIMTSVNYLTFNNAEVLATLPHTPSESTLDTTKTFLEAFIEAKNF